jgi:hypothetical protein
MKRVIGLFAVMLILSLGAWQHDGGGHSGGAPLAHSPEPLHGTPNVEANRIFQMLPAIPDDTRRIT